jgi:glucosamine--fructose-6-phosphate aminotransferase (isomerizing)
MAQTVDVLRGFDPGRMTGWRRDLLQKEALFVTGEGSSRIFPAKNLIDRARRLSFPKPVTTEGAHQAAEYAHDKAMIVGLSNSGRTRETVSFFERMNALKIPTHAITAAAGSPLTAVAQKSETLLCGAEKAVAASKSVVEQALLLQALLAGPEWAGSHKAADAAAHIFETGLPADVVQKLAEAQTVYVAGRNTGVAEEIALKSCEITRLKSFYLEGTYVLHGIEEVMQPQDCVVLVEPFKAEMARYQTVLEKGVGLSVIAIAAQETPFPTLRIPACDGFDNYLQLMAGWRLLAAAGQWRGVDIDKTVRARKVGNAVG